MENKHTMSDLYQMQSLPLSVKIRMTVKELLRKLDILTNDTNLSLEECINFYRAKAVAQRIYEGSCGK
jgi:hypothetical protein